MMNKKPETSLVEDLTVLGILAGDAKKTLGEDEKADKDQGGDGDGDADDKKADGEDAPKKENPFAKKDDDKADDKGAEKKEPSFIKDMKMKEAEKSYTEQLEMAWDVVRNYYGLDEAKDKTLTNEDLRTVIDAFAFIVESQYNSDKPTENPDDIPGANNVDAFPAGEDPIKQNAAFEGPLGLGKKNAVAGAGHDLMDTGAKKRAPDSTPKGKVASPRHQSEPKGESLDDLVNELKGIQSAVVESGPSAETLAVSSRLIEGFEAVRDTAGEVATRIKAELAEAKGVTEGDARVKAREYFESIFNDTTDILAAIAEGNVEIADATADLKVISSDLKKGLDGLKDVG